MVLREDADKLHQWGAQDTVLIFRKPVSDGDIARARAFAGQNKAMQVLYMPGDQAAKPIRRTVAQPGSASGSGTTIRSMCRRSATIVRSSFTPCSRGTYGGFSRSRTSRRMRR